MKLVTRVRSVGTEDVTSSLEHMAGLKDRTAPPRRLDPITPRNLHGRYPEACVDVEGAPR